MAQAGTVTVSGGGNVTPAKKLIIAGGRKFKNLIPNGNFTNGIDGWSSTSSTISAANNTLYVTGDGSSMYAYVYTQDKIITPFVGQKIYLCAKVKVTNDACQEVRIYTINMRGESIYNPTKDKDYTISSIAVQTNEIPTRVYIYSRYIDVSTAEGKVTELKEIIAVDLTAEFGAGNEPDLAWCDANIPQNIIW